MTLDPKQVGMIDIALIFDVTGSMYAHIEEAVEKGEALLREFAAQPDINVRYALVFYGDHRDEHGRFDMLKRVVPFSPDVGETILSLTNRPDANGGDNPEAVYDGLIAAGNLAWRPGSERLAYIFFDAPPHGEGIEDDRFPNGCPCKATPNGCVEVLGGRRIRLHAIHFITGCEDQDAASIRTIGAIAEATGGTMQIISRNGIAPAPEVFKDWRPTRSAASVLDETTSLMPAARQYMEVAEFAPDDIGTQLGWTEEMVQGIEHYLTDRGILGTQPEVVTDWKPNRRSNPTS